MFVKFILIGDTIISQLQAFAKTVADTSSAHKSLPDGCTDSPEYPTHGPSDSFHDSGNKWNVRVACDLGQKQRERARSFALDCSRNKSLDILLSFDAMEDHRENADIAHAFLAGKANRPLSSEPQLSNVQDCSICSKSECS